MYKIFKKATVFNILHPSPSQVLRTTSPKGRGLRKPTLLWRKTREIIRFANVIKRAAAAFPVEIVNFQQIIDIYIPI